MPENKIKRLQGKKVLILGGSVMQLPIIKTAKKLGMFVIVMDKNHQAPGMKIADIPLFTSISNKEQAILATIETSKKYGKIEGVVTVGTDFSTTVSAIAKRLKLPATKESVAKRCTDKNLMRQTLRKGGLIQPLFRKVEKREKFSTLREWKNYTVIQWKNHIISQWENDSQKKNPYSKINPSKINPHSEINPYSKINPSEKNPHLNINPSEINPHSEKNPYPAVVKPIDSMGARGVIRVNDDEELKKALSYSLKFSATGQLLIEQYLLGKKPWSGELSIDALIFGGKINITGIADRMIAHEPYFVEDGHIIPSVRGKEIIDASVKTFKKAIKVMKIDHGAAKGDIILTEKGPVIGEIAARLSGGFMSGYTYPLSSGVNLMEKMLLVACGINPHPLQEKNPNSPRGKNPLHEKNLNSPRGKNPLQEKNPNSPRGKNPLHEKNPNSPRGKNPLQEKNPNSPRGKNPIQGRNPNSPRGKNPIQGRNLNSPRGKKTDVIVVEHALYARPGKIKDIENVEEVKSIKGVKHLFINVKKGSEVKNPENNLMKCGNVIVSAPTLKKSMNIVKKVQKTISFRI